MSHLAHTSSLLLCLALLALKDEPASLWTESSFGRGMLDGESANWGWGLALFGVPLKVPVADMATGDYCLADALSVESPLGR